jgi:hypothetical protein
MDSLERQGRRRQPTNREIFDEVRTISSTLKSHSDKLERHEESISVLVTWKATQDAIKSYMAEERQVSAVTGSKSKEIDWVKIIIAICGVCGAALAGAAGYGGLTK